MSAAIKSLVVVIAISVAGFLFYKHSGFFLWSHQPMQYMPNMHRTPVLKAQRKYDFFADGSAARVPPVGTEARGIDRYLPTIDVLAQDIPRTDNVKPITVDVLARGKLIYNSYCIVCHGVSGWGDGSIIGKYPAPPTLHSDKLREYADSQIYHVITVGQNRMGGYGHLIKEDDRWALIHYVRALQRAETPTQEDLDLLDQRLEK